MSAKSHTAQIILYNQLRKSYLHPRVDNFFYIHHTGKINFLGKELKINTASKIIDYAGGKNFISELGNDGYKAEFSCARSYYVGILRYAKAHGITQIFLVQPCENYVYKNFLIIQEKLEAENIKLVFLEDTESFFLPREEFEERFSKPPVMEKFYRFMRQRENILMTKDGKPEGGKWNFDAENRKFDTKHHATKLFTLEKNRGTQEAERFYGAELKLYQPTRRSEALEMLEYFVRNHLERFGELEDAMYEKDPYVYHSLLSTAINFGLLSPREVVERISRAHTAMNNKEGFIRQILGWREYMYHFFHHYKDSIYQKNHFHHTEPLQDYFWKDAKSSKMNCLSKTLTQVHRDNFSHHIQRLMVIGNFALLTKRDPHELNRWFFEYYTDAFEWVVSPNVLAMSQFADGGRLATKPYIASANYISKMSDYCASCEYNHKEKYTDDACPLNYLYWAFVEENQKDFQGRQPFVLKNLQKIDIEKVKQQKEIFLTFKK